MRKLYAIVTEILFVREMPLTGFVLNIIAQGVLLVNKNKSLTNLLYFDKVLRMNELNNTVWQSPSPQQFAEVIAVMSDVKDIQAFLRDVMTEKEIIEISSRLQAARMLDKGIKYTEIVEKTKLSSRTIARISDWMKNGYGGYAKAINLVNAHHSHISPVRAE